MQKNDMNSQSSIDSIVKAIEIKLIEHAKNAALNANKILCLNFSDSAQQELKRVYPESQIDNLQFQNLTTYKSSQQDIDLILVNLSLGQTINVNNFLTSMKEILNPNSIMLIAELDEESKQLLLSIKSYIPSSDNTDIIAHLAQISLYNFIVYKDHLFNMLINDHAINCNIVMLASQEMLKTYKLLLRNKFYEAKVLNEFIDETRQKNKLDDTNNPELKED